MFVNDNGKYTEHAKYFYNDYNDCFCVIGTTISVLGYYDLVDLFASEDLLEEVEMPDYITEDYDDAEW